jgi:hypothetical protein
MEAASKNKNGPIIPHKEHVYLDGPKSRGYELGFAWRVFWQFIKGFRNLHFIGPCITVFGSARFKEDHLFYQQAREFGKRIAESGFTTMTGGGPGIMEAIIAEHLKTEAVRWGAISCCHLNKRRTPICIGQSLLSIFLSEKFCLLSIPMLL